MAKISAKARKKLAASANPKARASEMVAKGKLSAAKAAKGRHCADAVLGKHDTSYHNKG